MAEKEVLIKEGLEHKGVFNFSDYYEFAYKWLKDEGYDVIEEKYEEKVSGNSRDIAIEWKAGQKMTDYFKFDIGVRFLILGATDVEVEIEGSRKKMNKGKIEMGIKGTIVKDPESKWDEAPVSRFLRDTYNKYIIPKQIEKQEDKLKDDIQDFQEALKAFLELQGRRK